MPPCRLLIFVCFSLFARREASFISPDCHYPALNFHRAGREAGQGEAGRGAARALGGPVGLSPAPRGPCVHTASLNRRNCFSPSLSVAFDLPAARFGGFFPYSHFTVKKLRLHPPPSIRAETVNGSGDKAPPSFSQKEIQSVVGVLNPGRAPGTWNSLTPLQEAGRQSG